MFDKAILTYVKLLRFIILPGLLGSIANFIGPPHSPLIKTAIGVLIGMAIQHRNMSRACNDAAQAIAELFDEIFEEDDD